MTKIFYSLLLIVGIPHFVSAQPGKIDTDRPDQSESPSTVPKNWLQVEAGIGLQKNNDLDEYEYAHPTILTKYGIGNRIELRLITTFQSNSYLKVPRGTVINSGLLPVEIGTKINLFEEKGWRPKTSLLVHFGIPKAASRNYDVPNLAPRFRFAFQKTISNMVALGCNLGAEWDGSGDEKPTYIYTFAPGFDLSENWYAYIEAFGFLRNDGPPENSLAAGFARYIGNDIKIDLSGGFGISAAAPIYYAALGLSFRVNMKKMH